MKCLLKIPNNNTACNYLQWVDMAESGGEYFCELGYSTSVEKCTEDINEL
jgi:hypothetical protein